MVFFFFSFCLGSVFVAKFGAKSSYGLLPLWMIHHKIDKTNIAQHSHRAAREIVL
jgi:hypothetical protein